MLSVLKDFLLTAVIGWSGNSFENELLILPINQTFENNDI